MQVRMPKNLEIDKISPSMEISLLMKCFLSFFDSYRHYRIVIIPSYVDRNLNKIFFYRSFAVNDFNPLHRQIFDQFEALKVFLPSWFSEFWFLTNEKVKKI